jgi:transcription initiation factor IIE alpha subunit
MTDEIKQAIQLLEENGYKITAPPKEVKDEYTFERAWNLYGKKVGCKEKLEKKWNSMSKKELGLQ